MAGSIRIGHTFYAQKAVPTKDGKPLRVTNKDGKPLRIVQVSLGTDSRAEALRKLPAAVADIEAMFARARGEGGLAGEALALRDRDPRDWFDDALQRTDLPETFYHVAGGNAQPVTEALRRWHDDATDVRTGKTRQMDEQAVALLQAKLGELVTVEGVGRTEAADFLWWLKRQQSRDGKRRSSATLDRLRSSLSSLWDWLIEEGKRTDLENPWRGHGGRRRRKKTGGNDIPGARKRTPYTDDQLVALLSGRPRQPALADVLRIGLFSGMRLDEICSLRASDVTDGVMHVREGKTENAERDVPIHLAIAGVFRRRITGKACDDPLFPDIPEGGPDGTRGFNASKWFTRYRRSVGVEPEPGKLLDFHSLRHTFKTAMHDAGVHPRTIDWLCGHAPPGMTGVYDAGPNKAERRRAIRKLRYPKKVMEAV